MKLTWQPSQMDAKDNIKTILIWTQQIKPMDITHLQAKDQNHGYLVMGMCTTKDGLLGWLGLVFC